MHEIKAAFLMPDGWHFKHEVKGNTLAYFISKENIDREGRFETGLTLNVVRGLTSVTADKYAKEFIATLASRNELLRNWEIRVGTFTGYGCQVKAAPGPGRPAVIIHELAIANTRTNTLYILLFESPEATWGNEWEKGRVMTEAFALDDEV